MRTITTPTSRTRASPCQSFESPSTKTLHQVNQRQQSSLPALPPLNLPATRSTLPVASKARRRHGRKYRGRGSSSSSACRSLGGGGGIVHASQSEPCMSIHPDSYATYIASADTDTAHGFFCLKDLRSDMNTVDLYFLLSRAKSMPPAMLISMLSRCEFAADKCIARYSDRFQAVIMRWVDCFIWITNIDSSVFIFAIAPVAMDSPELQIWGDRNCKGSKPLIIPVFGLPHERSTSWTDIQQQLVDTFEDDDHVRAFLAACVVSFNYAPGDYTCALEELVPAYMRCFPDNTSQNIEYDMPIDDDILSVLADVRITREDIDGSESTGSTRLYYELGDGHCAEVMASKNERQRQVSHLRRIPRPKCGRKYNEFSSRGGPLVPMLYGFGGFLNCADASSTQPLNKFFKCVDGQRYPKLFRFLKSFQLLCPRLFESGKLDLSSMARLLQENKGYYMLGRCVGRIRRIRGNVLLIRPDGVYITDRFSGKSVAGGLEVNLLFAKLHFRNANLVDVRDKAIQNMRQVAEYILGDEYTECDAFNSPTRDTHIVYAPRNNMWGHEVAIANGLAALLCRKFYRFAGYSTRMAVPNTQCTLSVSGLYNSKQVDNGCENGRPVVDADVYVPMLHLLKDPHQDLSNDHPVKFVLYNEILCSSLVSKLLEYKPWVYGKAVDHDMLCSNVSINWAYGNGPPEKVQVEGVSVHLHNNPFREVKDSQDQVHVFANIS